MTNQYFWNRIASPDANLRAGDADREQIAERLRVSHSEGRLDIDEFQQRLEQCYEAKTFGELRELVRDQPRQQQQDRRQLTRSFSARRWRLVPILPILLALLVISAATGRHGGDHVFWLWVPLLFLFWRLSWWRRRQWPAESRRGRDDWL
jgi:Domain of unknown function (DUF1707)